ncbi:helix-turn-helix domain-containing protein [Blautia stercoris]
MNNLGNKKIMSKNILYYMDKHQKTRNEMCEALGVKYTTFTDWVKGNSYPRIDKIELMANYFGISKADLVEEHSQLETISIQKNSYENSLIDEASKLNQKGKVKLLNTVQEMTCSPLYNDNYLQAVAAHERTDIKATDEMRKHDDDIMDDENF